MKGKIIRDIRVYRSTIPNSDGNPMPEGFTNKKAHIALTRLAMKLEESGLSLGDFDHLYLNFTTCLPEGTISPAERSRDPYWYQYWDVGVRAEDFHRLQWAEAEFYLHAAQKVLVHLCPESKQLIESDVCTVLAKGQDLLILRKQKKAACGTAIIHLRLLDDGYFLPLLTVLNPDGEEILHVDLPRTLDLMQLGEIQLNRQRVMIKPRKNAVAALLDLEPITFELKQG